jgi:transcription termination/antitermination protein NusA
MTPEQLEAIEGIGPKTVEKISIAVNNYFAGLEGGETVAAEGESAEAAAEAVNEESLDEGTVEADALTSPADQNAGEAENAAPGEEERADLAAQAEPTETARTEDAEAAAEDAATEEAPDDKQS